MTDARTPMGCLLRCLSPPSVCVPSSSMGGSSRYDALCDHARAAAAPSSSLRWPVGSCSAGPGDPHLPHRRPGVLHTEGDRRQPPPARRTRPRRRDVARAPHDPAGDVLPAGDGRPQLRVHRPGDAVHGGCDRRGHLGSRIREPCPTPAGGGALPDPARRRHSPESAAAPLPRRIKNIEIESLYLAAQEQARIGGDFYEAADTPYGLRLLIGDVRGKGLSAVGAASAVISCFREAAYDEPDLRGITHRLDTSINRHSATFPAHDLPERFATALIAEIPHGGGHVRLLNCGHPRRSSRTSGRSASWSPPLPRRPSTSRR